MTTTRSVTDASWPWRRRAVWGAVSVGLAFGQPARAEMPPRVSETEVFPRLSEDAVRIRFHLGGVRDNAPDISPVLPDMPGPASAWYLAQWQKRDPLRPERMLRADPAATDPRLGPPLVSFPSASGESRLDIYRGEGSAPVFGLTSAGGTLTAAGGANVFLSVNAAETAASLDAPTVYRVGLKLTQASVAARDPRSLDNGDVLAQVFTGFTLRFTDPATGKVTPAFLQIPHADSREGDPTHRQCSLSNGTAQLLTVGGVRGRRLLPFAAAAPEAPLASLAFDLNREVCALARAEFQCSGGGASQRFRLPASAMDLANWRIGSLYIGLETQDSVEKAPNPVRGSVRVSLQVSDPRVSQDVSPTRRRATCTAGGE
ncbi:hypothetical protein ASF39_14445 [Methylobacterium sp. Leaf108]|nr:hypothetical protein ASF39_14445 [Methylobacterium sp. Leaf108]